MGVVCLVGPGARSEDPPATPAVVQPRYDGRVRLDYDFQSQGSSRYSDFYGYWYGNARDLANGQADVYVAGRQHNELDNASPYDGTYWSLDNAEGVSDSRLLQAYLDAHDRDGDMRLRLGRQYVDVADYLQIDGGQAILFENRGLGGRAYFGQPVSYYSSVAGDLAGGLSLVGRPWSGNRARFSYADYYDHSEGQGDQNYFVDIQQEITDTMRSRAQLSVLNDEFRMAHIDCSFFDPQGDVDMHAGVSRWGEFDANTIAYSPLYQQLGPQQPYTYLYAKLSYAITPKWMLSPGVSISRTDDGDQNFSNNDYNDYDLTLIFEPDKAFSASVSLQYWDIQGGNGFLGLSGEARYRYRRIWEVSLGSAYVDYTYNSYSDISYSVNDGQTVFHEDGTVTTETPYALSYFLRAKWNITRRLVVRLQGEIEDDQTQTDLNFRCLSSVEVRL